VVPFKSVLLLATLALLSPGLRASDPVKEYLTLELVKATLDYEEVFERCEASAGVARDITLPIAELARHKITLQELHFAIVYFRDKALEECSSDSRSRLISAILDCNTYAAASPNAPIDPERSGLGLLLPSQNLLEARALYLQLDRGKSELLNAIFQGSSPTLEKISNWQDATNLLRKE